MARSTSKEAMAIVCDPQILGGKPVIRGTRISVDLILELVEAGYTIDQIVREYPHLSKQAVRGVVALARRIHEAVSYERVRAAS